MSESIATPKEEQDSYQEFSVTHTKRNQPRYYGVKDGRKTRISEANFEEGFIRSQGLEVGQPPFSAIWHAKVGDLPVTVVGLNGREGEEDVLRIEGSDTGVPRSELEWLDEKETKSNAPETDNLEDRLSKLETRLQIVEEELRQVTLDRDALSERVILLQDFIKENGLEIPDELPQYLSVTTKTPEPTIEIPPHSEVVPSQMRFKERMSYWRDKVGLGATRIITHTRYDGDVKTDEIVEKKGSKLPAFIVGGTLGAIAVWLMMKNGDSGISLEEFQTIVSDQDKISDNQNEILSILDPNGISVEGNAFTDLSDKLEALQLSNASGNESGSGQDLNFYNLFEGSRTIAVEVPKGVSLEGTVGSYDLIGPGRKVLVEGVEWDRQGNLAQWVRQDLIDQGYDLHQKTMQYVKTNGQSGTRYYTDIG